MILRGSVNTTDNLKSVITCQSRLTRSKVSLEYEVSRSSIDVFMTYHVPSRKSNLRNEGVPSGITGYTSLPLYMEVAMNDITIASATMTERRVSKMASAGKP